MGIFGKKKPLKAKTAKRKRRPYDAVERALLSGIAVTSFSLAAFSGYHLMPQQDRDYVDAKVCRTALALHLRDDLLPPSLTYSFTQASAPKVFGEQSKPVKDRNDGIAQEWTQMMARQEKAMQDPENAATFHAWLSQLVLSENTGIAKKAAAVDGLVDKYVTYANDADIYKTDDYWATPLETLANKKGDCEDFAILKYYALRALGVPAERMYMVIVGDAGTGKANHATLVIDVGEKSTLTRLEERLRAALPADRGGDDAPAPRPMRIVLLENDQSPWGALRKPSEMKYDPYYAMNEHGVWILPAPKETPKAAPTPVPKPAPPGPPLS